MTANQSNRRAAIHKALIAELQERFPEIQTKGLWAALRSLPDAEYTQELLASDDEWVVANRFVPDAWAIDPVARTVAVFEVVSTHDVPQAKILRMIRLMWAIDQDEYDLVLFRVDMTGVRAYDLQGLAILDRCAAVDGGDPTESPLTALWQYYTAERVEARLEQGKAI